MSSRRLGSGKFLVTVRDTSIVVEGVPEDFEVRVEELGKVVPGSKGELPRYPDLEEAIDIGRDLLQRDFTERELGGFYR